MAATSPLLLCLKNARARKRWLKHHHKWPRANKTVDKIPAKAKGKAKVIEESLKKDEGKKIRKQFPDLLLQMGFFLEEPPLSAYIMDIIDHHGWCNFYVGPTIMQPSVVRAFYEGKVDDEEDMVIVHGCEIHSVQGK